MFATAIDTAGFVCAGAAAWTLLEYSLHRGLGHRWTGNAFGREHTRHHATTHYFAPGWKKALAAAPVVLATAAAAALALGPRPGLAFAAGLALAYVAYEVVHRRAHTHGPRGPYGRWLRRHHFHHHFHAPGTNHGVTSPVWDLVFGTYARPGTIRVPEKHAMPWLVDASGAVRPEHAYAYVVTRRRAPGQPHAPGDLAPARGITLGEEGGPPLAAVVAARSEEAR